MKDNNFNFNQVFLNTIDSGASEQVLSFLNLNNISVNISEKSLSILLAKASFAFLLISMLSYWFQMSFKSQRLMNSFRKNSEKIPQELIFSKGSPLQIFEIPPTKTNLTGIANQRFASYARPSTEMNPIPLQGFLRTRSWGYGVRGKQEADHKSKAITYNYNRTDRKNLYYFLEKVPFVSMWSANITLAFLLSIRWIESGHFPLSNLYESLIFLSWSLTVIHLFLENLFNRREQRESSTLKILGNKAEHPIPSSVAELRTEQSFAKGIPLRGKQIEDLRTPLPLQGFLRTRSWGSGVRVQSKAPTLTLGAITSPLALFTNAFATFSLPPEMQKVTVLVPALKSNWLIMHVSVMIISYAALLSGCLLAMAFLVIKFIDDNKIPSIMSTFINPLPLQGTQIEDLHPSSEASELHLNEFPKGFLLDPERFISVERSWGCNYQYLGDSGAKLRLPQRGMQSQELFNYSNSYQELEAEGSEAELGVAEPTKMNPSYAPLKWTFQGPEESPEEFISVEGYRSQESLLLAQRGNLIKENKVLLPQILDNLSYRSISLGFALLTIGILSGAVWANEAWGSYWSWDPKETWAFITWLVFALYLHTRLSKGWVGKESAFVASFGFIVIWFCYLGVNLFGKGLHSYGWFQQ